MTIKWIAIRPPTMVLVALFRHALCAESLDADPLSLYKKPASKSDPSAVK